MSNLKESILLIEDEESIGEGLNFNFEHEGLHVEWIKDGLEAVEVVRNRYSEFSLIVLDLMLPEVDGFEILKVTREHAKQIPVLVLSAKSLESDKVRALESGADDYVTKPFSLIELMLRVQGLVKRSKWYRQESVSENIQLGEATFNLNSFHVTQKGFSPVRVSPTEVLLAKVFLENPNTILSRALLLNKVWNYDARMETRTVDVFLAKLRKYVEKNPAQPQHLISVRGVGYAYVSDESYREALVGKK
jgi:DNA-binding response OmpR family regulator